MLAGGENYYFHEDALGSIRNLTSGSGQTEWTYSYEPFGSARTETKIDTMAPDNTVRFAGELLDADSGLYDLRARQYDSVSGRFLSLDPLPASRTQPYTASYAYASDSPAAWIDPSGLGPVWAPDGAAAVLAQLRAAAAAVLDRIHALFNLLRDGACGTSDVIGITRAIAPAVVFPFWLLGYMLTCTSLARKLAVSIGGVGRWTWSHRADIAAFAGSCVGGVFGEAGLTQYAAYGAHQWSVKVLRGAALRAVPLLEGPWAPVVACVGSGVGGYFGKQSFLGPG